MRERRKRHRLIGRKIKGPRQNEKEGRKNCVRERKITRFRTERTEVHDL